MKTSSTYQIYLSGDCSTLVLFKIAFFHTHKTATFTLNEKVCRFISCHLNKYFCIQDHISNRSNCIYLVLSFLLLQQTAVQSSILFLSRTVDMILNSCYSNRQLFSLPSYFCPAQLTRFCKPVQL